MALVAPVSGRRLSVDQVDDLVRLARLGVDYREVSARVSCALSTVYSLVGPAILARTDGRSGLHLSLADREEIRAGVEPGDSPRAIARLLNRDVCSREIARNGGRDAYRA
jgi:hypothetical protein